MSYPVFTLVFATGLLSLVAGWDIARRRIPNWANAALGATGLGAQVLFHGWRAALGGLGAAILCLVILWKPWTKGKLGGGDVKATLCAATWLGLSALPRFFVMGAVIVGVLALVSYFASSRTVRQEVRQNLKLVALRAMPEAPIRSGNGRVSVPFGAGAAASAILMLWWT